jgi:hypothetical protein
MNPWLQEKSSKTIMAVAHALCDIMPLLPATAAQSLRYALWNACKIYVHTIETETGKSLDGLHTKMSDFIFENPDQAEALLDATRFKALQP